MTQAKKLTDVEVRKAAVDPEKVIRLKDELGLYLEIAPSGTKSWRLRVRRAAGDTIKTLGSYPAMSLGAARAARAAIRDAGEITPLAVTPPPAAAPTFEAVVAEWHGTNKVRWAEKHAATVLSRLKKETFALLGDKPIDEIKAPAIKELLKGIEARGTMDHAHDIRQGLEAVFNYAMAAGMCSANPAAAMRHVLKPLPKAVNRPAARTLEEAKHVLAAAEALPALPVTRLALRLLALTAQRPGEVRKAAWPEFGDIESPEPVWSIPAEHMKMKKPHAVPLSRQAVDVLRVLQRLTGKMPVAFPHSESSTKPLSENAIGYLLNRAGFYGRHVPHGWRASFSTIMNERLPADRAVIDLMLAHEPKDKVEAAYNRSVHMERRREIAQLWADLLLDGLPPAVELLDLPRRKAA